MSRGGIIIQNRGDGRGMMIPEREGCGTFNKLPFVSMATPKEEIGINPVPAKVIIKTRKVYPRKIKSSKKFWKKNENPIFKEYNKNCENQNGNKNKLKYISNNDNDNKSLTNNLKTP